MAQKSPREFLNKVVSQDLNKYEIKKTKGSTKFSP